MTSMEVDGAGTSSARRRRERRLRSWWRHERMSVAAALAEAHHHSAPKVGAETHYALRRQKTASAARPGVLEDPAPQGAVTVGYVAAPVPTLALSVLAGSAGEAVDDRSLRFLLGRSLAETKEEEEKKAKEEEEELDQARRELRTLLAVPEPRRTAEQETRVRACRSVLGAAYKRKRKKRRKRRTPRTSSLPGRARRRHRQWHVSLRHVVDVPVVRSVQFPQVLISSNDDICADIYIYFRFKLIGKGRSEQWEVFLYCDKTIKVDRDSAEVSPRAVPPFALGGVGFGSSPNLDTKLTIYELCLPSERGCVELSCGGGFFTPGGAYDSVWDMVKPMTGKYFVNYFQYQFRWVCMHAEFRFSNHDEICADNYFFPVQVEGKCRSEKWDLYLYGDMTIKVDRDTVEVLPRGVPPPRFFTLLGNGHTPSMVVPAF